MTTLRREDALLPPGAYLLLISESRVTQRSAVSALFLNARIDPDFTAISQQTRHIRRRNEPPGIRDVTSRRLKAQVSHRVLRNLVRQCSSETLSM